MSVVVSLEAHPAFQRRVLSRQARRLSEDCRDLEGQLHGMRAALIEFDARLAHYHSVLMPTWEDSRATLAVLDSGDVAAMETLRDVLQERRARAR